MGTIRKIIEFLIGKENTANLYGEDKTSEKFQCDAERIGATVIALNRKPGPDARLRQVVYPLADSEKKKGEENKEYVFLWYEINLDGNTGDHAAAAGNDKRMPPVLNFKPGEIVTHAMIIPNKNICSKI